jgi:hypothetical protein
VIGQVVGSEGAVLATLGDGGKWTSPSSVVASDLNALFDPRRGTGGWEAEAWPFGHRELYQAAEYLRGTAVPTRPAGRIPAPGVGFIDPESIKETGNV